MLEIETELPPRELKERLQEIEARLGRRRTGDELAARPIDLDLLLYEDVVVDEPGLALPHPDVERRPFVAIPLAELAPERVLPGTDLLLRDVAAKWPRAQMGSRFQASRPQPTRAGRSEASDGRDESLHACQGADYRLAVRFAEACRQPAPRSFWRQRLERVAGGQPVEDYLIDQANLRGFHGAYRVGDVRLPIDPSLSLEDIVVGLLHPLATVDARVLKLVVRILQSGRIDPRMLWLGARRERADHVLYWLVQLVPEVERTPPVEAIRGASPAPPRGYRPPNYRYSPERLVRRPASREDLWRKAQR